MRVKIYTQEACPVCGAKFQQSPSGLYCADHPRVQPRHYYLKWSFRNEAFRLFGFDSFREAAIKAAAIETEIDSFTFNPAHYLKQRSSAKSHRHGFTACFGKWLEIREKEVSKGMTSPAHYNEMKRLEPLYCNFFGQEDVRLILEHRINDFFHSLPDRLKPKSQKNYMIILRAFFYYLKDVDRMIREVPGFPAIKVQAPAVKWLETDVQAEIMKHIPSRHIPIFQFMFETGCRPQEARALTPKDVSIKDATAQIRSAYSREELRTVTKTKQERLVPLSPEMTESIKAILKAQIGRQHVFLCEGRHYTQSRLYIIWRRACKKAGISCSMYGGTRHSIASQLVNQGVPLSIIGELLGHACGSTTAKYSHVKVEALRKVLNLKRRTG